jgi:hypothetical protein
MMIDINNGRIVLCKSGFVISSEVCPNDIEEKIPDRIAYRYTVNSGWSHYFCWLDIEDGEYIYASLSFFGNRLESISIQPQYSASAPKGQPNVSDAGMNFEGIREWCQKYFALEKQAFPWGEVALCRETDPIYHPSQLIIKYK